MRQASVRKADKSIRISARLVEAETGVSIGPERYDRRLDDIFEVQHAIAMSLIGAIEPNLVYRGDDATAPGAAALVIWFVDPDYEAAFEVLSVPCQSAVRMSCRSGTARSSSR